MKFLGTLVALLLVSLVTSDLFAADPMDWPNWRGPEMNGISRERDLPDSFNPEGGEGSNLVWMKPELATRSTPIVMNGKIYLLARDKPDTENEGEKVVCADANSGSIIWEHRFNAYLTDVPNTRLCWSSVVGDPETGNVYAQGVCGLFLCLDGNKGEVIWSHSMHEEFGLLSTYGGRTNYPVVYENMVIVSGVIIGWGEMAKPAHRFIAFDKSNGQPVWFNGTKLLPEDTTYSSPMFTVINGQAQMIFGSGDGAVYGFQPRTGKQIWNYMASRRGINTAPFVAGTTVFCGHSEENPDSTTMGGFFALDGSKTGDIKHADLLWRNQELFVGRASPIMVDDKLIVLEDTGTLMAIDPKTGKLLFKTKVGRYAYGSPVYADGKLYIADLNGLWWIVKVGAEKFEVVHKLRLEDHEVFASPVISHGKIYLATLKGMYCIGKPGIKPIADAMPEPPVETDYKLDQTAAFIQVAPVEALLSTMGSNKPHKQNFQVRLYNKLGQYIDLAKPEDVSFTLEGPGSIDKNGRYIAPGPEGAHQTTVLTAKVGELSGTARIRIAPPLDWEFTFDKGVIPSNWVGIRYRHVGIDFDLYQELSTANPLAGQIYLYLTTEFTNNNPQAAMFDDSTPRETWTQFLRYLRMDIGDKRPKNAEEAQKVFDPVLNILKEKGVLDSWTWDTWSKKTQNGEELTGPKVSFKRGTRRVEGNGVMMKNTVIPKGTRSQGWMGVPNLSDYTIQADIQGAVKDGQLPEVGLTAQRYCMKILGEKQVLQIHTWYSHEKNLIQTVPFEFKPDVWYTMKLMATHKDGVAILKGKIWLKDQAEPEAWTIEVEDKIGNTVGSPGFFGNANVSEVFYDNVKVYQNNPASVLSQKPAEMKPTGDKPVAEKSTEDKSAEVKPPVEAPKVETSPKTEEKPAPVEAPTEKPTAEKSSN